MKKRVLLMGPTGCGKTTLANLINGESRPIRPTQDMIYGPEAIDTPGAYVDNTWMYSHLIAAAQNAYLILILVDQVRCGDIYSPGFATPFTRPVAGVISKADLAPENEGRCMLQLKRMGITSPVFKVSALLETGTGPMLQLISEQKELWRRGHEVHNRNGTAGAL